MAIRKYGLDWPNGSDPLAIELAMIKHGGTINGQGLGMFEHVMEARRLVWPDRYRHRWTDLVQSKFCRKVNGSKVTILIGSGSSQKTAGASEYGLVRYWASPDDTLIILSTTTVQKLDNAIFGEVKMLWKMGVDRYPWLAGNVIEYKHAICTDDVGDGEVRDVRKGIQGLACYQGKQFVGLGVYSGIKQRNVIFIADELQFMSPTFLDCLPNMMQGCERLEVIGSGNPKHDPLDQLGKAAEPKAGWNSLGDIEKTTVWENTFENGITINLVGTDSPNFDYPENEPTHYPGLVSWITVRSVAKKWGKDSLEYYKQCKGVMKIGMIGNRVITAQLCTQHRAQEKAVWKDDSRVRIYGCDPAWGGVNSDRCIGGWVEFGTSSEGVQIIRVNPPRIIPILANIQVLPEDQIAKSIQRDASEWGIDPANIFYDSTGRGTLGSAFARIFGDKVPVPIAFGDRPSTRPVRHDLFIKDKTGRRRHMRCDEHYGKFVTELWFSVRYVIECDQMRELPDDVLTEGTMREYYEISGTGVTKIDVEPKDDTRERMGCSPDLFDWLCVCIEGARQRGFQIRRLGQTEPDDGDRFQWLSDRVRKHHDLIRSKQLTYA